MSNPRCAFCHNTLGEMDLLVTCPGCQTVLHSDCTRESRGCPTLGCEHSFRGDVQPMPGKEVIGTPTPIAPLTVQPPARPQASRLPLRPPPGGGVRNPALVVFSVVFLLAVLALGGLVAWLVISPSPPRDRHPRVRDPRPERPKPTKPQPRRPKPAPRPLPPKPAPRPSTPLRVTLNLPETTDEATVIVRGRVETEAERIQVNVRVVGGQSFAWESTPRFTGSITLPSPGKYKVIVQVSEPGGGEGSVFGWIQYEP